MFIQYYIGSKPLESRSRDHVPRVGDIVKFGGIAYKVDVVVWDEDDDIDDEVNIILSIH